MNNSYLQAPGAGRIGHPPLSRGKVIHLAPGRMLEW